MRVILEKKDLISLLGKALGRKFGEKDVVVQADPFEVIIFDAESVLIPEESAALEEIKKVQVSKPSPPPADDDISMEALTAANRALAAQPPKTGKGAKKERTRMAGEVDTPIPPVDPLAGIGDDE